MAEGPLSRLANRTVGNVLQRQHEKPLVICETQSFVVCKQLFLSVSHILVKITNQLVTLVTEISHVFCMFMVINHGHGTEYNHLISFSMVYFHSSD